MKTGLSVLVWRLGWCMNVEVETGVNMEGEMDVYVERNEVCRWKDRRCSVVSCGEFCIHVACADTDVSVCAQVD